jgi:hypothetical protein
MFKIGKYTMVNGLSATIHEITERGLLGIMSTQTAEGTIIRVPSMWNHDGLFPRANPQQEEHACDLIPEGLSFWVNVYDADLIPVVKVFKTRVAADLDASTTAVNRFSCLEIKTRKGQGL